MWDFILFLYKLKLVLKHEHSLLAGRAAMVKPSPPDVPAFKAP